MKRVLCLFGGRQWHFREALPVNRADVVKIRDPDDVAASTIQFALFVDAGVVSLHHRAQ